MKIILIIIAIIPAALLIEIYRELHHFEVVTYEIFSEKLKGIGSSGKIVFLSDLHNQEYGHHNEILIQKIREIEPVLILIGGDMFVKKAQYSYEPALSFVKEIAKYFPVYYANGNHEQRRKENPEDYEQSYEDYKEELEASGVYFLENDSRDFLFEQCRVNITGLEIPEECYAHFHEVQLSAEEITDRIGEPQKNTYQILLAHNPTYMGKYVDWGADLILSGHLHGGVVRIPGVTGVISPAFQLFPKYSGDHYREGDSDIVVSKGLGVHTIKVRLFNPAELIVLNLRENTTT